jgi:hypothetical protein
MNDTTQSVSITDLAGIKKLIEVACSRGAFQAAEMQAVGSVYDRLSGFLDSVIKQAEQATQQGEQND